MLPSWTTFENALRSWIVTGSGLPGSSVVWGEGGGPRPNDPCIVLRLMDHRRRGRDWTVIEDAPEPQMPGAEIVHRAQGAREVTLRAQAFGAGAARRLQDAVLALRLPSVTEGLTAGGAGIGVVGPIQNVGAAQNWTHFESRAVVDVVIHAAAEVTEFGTWIESADVEIERA
jgi:hypothetical protein